VAFLPLPRRSEARADSSRRDTCGAEGRVMALKRRPSFNPKSFLEPILAKISQETLADMIGTTRSRVSFFMNKFRKLGFIDYNGGIEVHSSLLNVVLHDEPHIQI
jgi:hypothetical protein